MKQNNTTKDMILAGRKSNENMRKLLQKLKAYIERCISISVIEKPKEYDESKKPLDTHLRGHARFF